MLPRISYFYIKADIYTMKDSVYIEDKEKDYEATAYSKKPVAIAVIVSVVLILILNLINTMIFY